MEKAIAWFDVEANGRAPEADALLEVGLVVTDFYGEEVSAPYEALVQISNLKGVMEAAEPHVQEMHNRSGLWSDLWEKKAKSLELIDMELCETLAALRGSPIVFLGGNSIATDRNFAQLYLPQFIRQVSHMSIDGTSLATFLQENHVAEPFYKKKTHRALADVYDSIDEYRYHVYQMQTHYRSEEPAKV